MRSFALLHSAAALIRTDGSFSGAQTGFSRKQTPSVSVLAFFSAPVPLIRSLLPSISFSIGLLELRGFSRIRHSKPIIREFTAILFWVRVPVLSVQITVVEPSVSTDSSCLIRALREAILLEARLSARVTVGKRPSGTFATIIPIAKIMLPSKGS